MEHPENRCDCDPRLVMHEAGCPRDRLREERDKYRTALEKIIPACDEFFQAIAPAIGEERMKDWKILYTEAMKVLRSEDQ